MIQSRYEPAKHIAIKSILLTPLCQDLHQLSPEARFLISVRDPRDIVCSMIEVGEKQEKMGATNQYPRDVKNLASHIMAFYEPPLKNTSSAFQEKVMWGRYEDLVSNPSAIINDIQTKTGLDLSAYDPQKEWPSTLVDIKEDKGKKDPFVTDSWGAKLTSSSIGRYKDFLTTREKNDIKSICSPLLKTFQYSQ